jgi:hypothetical protein
LSFLRRFLSMTMFLIVTPRGADRTTAAVEQELAPSGKLE